MTICDDAVLRLRIVEPDDIDLLYAVENDPSLRSVSNTAPPYSLTELREHLLFTTGDIRRDQQLRLVIERAKDDVAVGMLDLTDYVCHHSRAQVGIVVLAHYRRRGYASRALSLLVDYARATLALHQLYAIVPCNNLASQKLFRAQDFMPTAHLTDWVKSEDKYADAELLQKIL